MKSIDRRTVYRMSGLVILAGIAAPVIAQPDLISLLDSDKDGTISLKEAVRDTALLQQFGQIDVNGDGFLTREELEKVELITAVDDNQEA